MEVSLLPLFPLLPISPLPPEFLFALLSPHSHNDPRHASASESAARRTRQASTAAPSPAKRDAPAKYRLASRLTAFSALLRFFPDHPSSAPIRLFRSLPDHAC